MKAITFFASDPSALTVSNMGKKKKKKQRHKEVNRESVRFFFVKTHLPGLSRLRLIFFKTENLAGEEGLAEVCSYSPGLTHNSSESLTREILLFPVTAAAKNQDDSERGYLKSRSYIR